MLRSKRACHAQSRSSMAFQIKPDSCVAILIIMSYVMSLYVQRVKKGKKKGAKRDSEVRGEKRKRKRDSHSEEPEPEGQ